MPNTRIPIPEQRRNPPPKNRVRFKNNEDPLRPRVPRQPTPNAIFLMMSMTRNRPSKKVITYLINSLRQHGWMDARNPCTYMERETTILTRKKMSLRQEDL